jgi:hypothetical protein
MEQQRFLYSDDASGCVASRNSRCCLGFLASLFCVSASAAVGSTANLASNHDTDDDMLRCDELDVPHGDRQWFAREHDLASESRARLGHDRGGSVLS